MFLDQIKGSIKLKAKIFVVKNPKGKNEIFKKLYI